MFDLCYHSRHSSAFMRQEARNIKQMKSTKVAAPLR